MLQHTSRLGRLLASIPVPQSSKWSLEGFSGEGYLNFSVIQSRSSRGNVVARDAVALIFSFLTVLLVTIVDLTKQSPQIGVLEYCLEEFSSRYINFDENTIVCKLMEIKIRRHILSLNMHPQKSLKHREGGRHNDFLKRQVLSGFVIRLATQTRV